MSARAQAARGYRLRPAPRAGRRGAAASRVRWDRVGRVALVLVLAAVLVSYVSPALNFLDAWRDSRGEHSTLADLRDENAKLRERLTILNSPDAAEREARRSGMVAVGEGAYVLHGLK
jgi:cell division protein FtsB